MKNTLKIRRYIALILTICLLLTFMPYEVLGAVHTYSKVRDLNAKYETIKDVTLREFPTTQSKLLNISYKSGTIVNVIAEWKNSAGNTWLQVKEGFIFEGNLKKHEHKGVRTAPDYSKYSQLNSEQHKKEIYSGREECICGAIIKEARLKSTTKEKHNFGKNSCTECGEKNYSIQQKSTQKNYSNPVYEPVEVNQNVSIDEPITQNNDNNISVCEPNDSNKTSILEHLHEFGYCESNYVELVNVTPYAHERQEWSGKEICSCGEIINYSKIIKTIIEEHSIGNMCECGYIKAISVINHPYSLGSEYHICNADIFEPVESVYKYINDELHEILFYSNRGICEICGNEVIPPSGTYSKVEKHCSIFENELECACGFGSEGFSEHYTIQSGYSISPTYHFLRWFGQIHEEVVNHIYTKYKTTGMLKNKQVNYLNGQYGRVDLVRPQTKEMWEVKRNTIKLSTAITQLEKYTLNILKDYPEIKKWKAGRDINPDSLIVNIGLKKFYVEYQSATPQNCGIIYYDYYEIINWELLEEVWYITIVVAGVATVIVVAPELAPFLIPALNGG